MALTNRDAKRRAREIGRRLAEREALARATSQDLANPEAARMGSFSEDEPELHAALDPRSPRDGDA